MQKLGHPVARDLLRYLSSELNRLYFQIWNVTQIAIGAVALWFAPRTPKVRWSIAAMLTVVVVMMAFLTPQIVSLGRGLDFVPRDPAPPGMRRFWILHAAYTSLEMIKLLVGGVAAFLISKDAEPRGRTSSAAATSL